MVVDASVIVSRLVPHDVHHEVSRRWLARHVAGRGLVIAPALLLPEVAAAVARRTGESRLARRAVDAVLRVYRPALRSVVCPGLQSCCEAGGSAPGPPGVCSPPGCRARDRQEASGMGRGALASVARGLGASCRPQGRQPLVPAFP